MEAVWIKNKLVTVAYCTVPCTDYEYSKKQLFTTRKLQRFGVYEAMMCSKTFISRIFGSFWILPNEPMQT